MRDDPVIHRVNWMALFGCRVTQSKSKTQITRSVHCKVKCITVKYNGTQHDIESKLILEEAL